MAPRQHAHTCPYEMTIALDFGTTYSGIAWTRESRCDLHPSRVTDALSNLNAQPKIPTVLHVNPQTRALEFHHDPTALLPIGSDTIQLFKFALMNPTEWNEGQGAARVVALLHATLGTYRLPLTTSHIVSIYLKGLWVWARKEAAQESTAGIAVTSKRVVITYPGGWSDDALGRFKEAANLAGIVTKASMVVSYCAEDKAALQSIRFPVGDKGLQLLKPGTFIMVADCGGMTVDVTVGMVSATETRQLSAIPSVPLLCRFTGATLLDVGFEQLLVKKIEKATGQSFGTFPIQVMDEKRRCMDQWHTEWKLNADWNSLATGISCTVTGHILHFHRDEIHKIYIDVTDQIAKDIAQHYRDTQAQGYTPKEVYLTGGLACSLMVQGRIRKLLPNLGVPDLRVVTRSESLMWRATCIGGALDPERIR